MEIKNYNNEFYVISDLLSNEELSFYSKYFFENAEPDNLTHRLNMLFYGLDHLDVQNQQKTIASDPLGDGTKLANIIYLCKDFIESNFSLDSSLEFKRSFIHIMQEGSEIDSHIDDGDVYEGKPEGEKHYSAVLVLNDDYEGGEFHFDNLNVSMLIEAGSLIVFRGDKKRLHGVREVTKGYRVSMPIFFRTVTPAF
jgi:predicted 2-oxoglutarate/Fe(II)-dependent dioxygenase YbiX